MKLIIEKLSDDLFRPVVKDGEEIKLIGADTKIANTQLITDIISQISAFPNFNITEVENQLEN